EQLGRALNGVLPLDIRVGSLEDAAPGFHAIRDAKRKRYRYRIWDAPRHDVFRRGHTWHVRTRLDDSSMERASRRLIGTHDFACFQAAGSRRATTIRTVTEARWYRDPQDADELDFEIEANGFLYNMVRGIVGSLVEVGRGSRSVEWFEEILLSGERTRAGPSAPPHGLYLVSVDY
ncbi:MAG TPA: tRNA pseudouridine synthase A, partial [Pirellulaceae bacterium]